MLGRELDAHAKNLPIRHAPHQHADPDAQ